MMNEGEKIRPNPLAKRTKLMQYVREEMQRHKQREAMTSQPDHEPNAQAIGSTAINTELTSVMPADTITEPTEIETYKDPIADEALVA